MAVESTYKEINQELGQVYRANPRRIGCEDEGDDGQMETEDN